LALLAGIKRKIGTDDPCETGLEGIAGDGQGGDMEFAFFLLEGIDPSRMITLEEGAAEISQIKLIIRNVQAILRGRPEAGQG